MSRDKEADEKFQRAVEEYLGIQGYGDGLLMDWILVTSQHHINDDSSTSTSLSIHVPFNQPMYRSAGLISYADTKTREHFIT